MNLENKEIISQLIELCGEDSVLTEEPMSRHTTFRVGGPADYFVSPHNEQEILGVQKICEEAGIPWFVVGNGSNLVVSDKGYRGVILSVYKNFQGILVDGCRIEAGAGAMLSAVSHAAKDNSLTGMEFASGIPGTLGGAVMMNAGAYGGEMQQIIDTVKVMTPEGEVKTLEAGQMEFGYRTSVVKKKHYIVLSAVLKLQAGEKEQIQAKMQELKNRRVEKQPLEYPSAGSAFKRPQGYFAGKLIMDAGLAGFSVGGAQVSEKHCGFVINKGGATASDVVQLMGEVQRKVQERFGVWLEPEIQFLGQF
ncbi:MAG: UDP-N-acetylmuramate dehydrogenase [Lachnospiraceae bacterium]|nr:UDP-N-acetylmuramate dehydrogenase [Lachnospiraceae bacterium]